MESQGVAPKSRLAQMQMRFQQKQLQEREQRRHELITAAAPQGSELTGPPKPIGNGKVRQMFDERRRGAGIDRGNPLKPIVSKTSTTSTATLTSGGRVGSATPAGKKTFQTSVTRTTLLRQQMNERRNGPGSNTTLPGKSSTNGHLQRSPKDFSYDELDNLENETFPKGFSSLSLNDNAAHYAHEQNNNRINNTKTYNSNNNNRNSTLSRVKSTSIGLKLNPVVTKKSPSVQTIRSPVQPPAPQRTSSVTRARPSPNAGAHGKAVNSKPTPPFRSQQKMASTVKMRAATPEEGMAVCRYCQRHFLQERLVKHENICQKMANNKRKVFDAARHRVMGTEAESYVKKTGRTGPSVKASAATSVISLPSTVSAKKNNWRKKHEEFITAIRAAKQMQAHLARGGKLSDLPPPPPSENPDYIECPHCHRRFNEAAAERHIPKCATMLHNKPKPGNGGKKK